MSKPFEKLAAHIDSMRDQMVAFAQELIAIPALGPDNGGQGEWKKAQVIRAALETFADEVQDCHATDPRVESGQRPNFLALIKGKTSDRRCWFLAHMDVVPPGKPEDWESSPFSGVVKDGKIYGRGAEDNHQGLVSSLFAAKAFKETGAVPPCDIGLLLLSDEETGNEFGIQHILQQVKPFRPGDLIVVPDGGVPSGEEIELAEKGILWLKCTVTGKSAHGSMPQHGINAHRASAKFILALEQLYDHFHERIEMFNPPTSTFEPTVQFANEVSFNIIPGKAAFGLDCRLLPGLTSDTARKAVHDLAATIEKECNVTITIETVQDQGAAPATDQDAPVVRCLQEAIREVNKVEPRLIGIGGGTFAAYIRQVGFPAAVYAKLDNTLHGPNEYCRIQNLMDDTKIFAHVCLNA